MSSMNEIESTLKALRHGVPHLKSGDLIGPGSLHYQSLAQLQVSLREVESQFSKAAPSALPATTGKTNVVTSINIVTSLMDGMESGDVEFADLEQGVTMLTASMDEAVATVGSYKPNSTTERQRAEDRAPVSEQLFGKLRKYGLTLPTKASKKDDPFIIKYLPILPAFEGVVTTEQLAKIGFKIEAHSGFYSVLGNQLVLGINLEHPDLPANLTQYAHQLLDIVGRKLGERYSLMGDELILGAGRRIPSSKGYVYFWAVPHGVLNRMNHLLGETVLSDWGFPFK